MFEISFGKKIPVANCKIKDIQKNRFVDATLYEFDCKDLSDIEEIKKLYGNWHFKNSVANEMRRKYSYFKNYKKQNNHHFFVLEADKEPVGIAGIKHEEPNLILNYLESEHEGRYKYIGKNMINLFGKIAVKNHLKRIYIPIPLKSSRDFYIKKCMFKENKKDKTAKLSRFGMMKLQMSIDRLLNSKTK